MTALKRVKSHPDVIDYFKELQFYNKHIEKPKIKHLKSIDLLSELHFYEKLLQSSYSRKKDPINQLEASKSSIKDFFSDILNETKGFNYQMTLKVLLKKYKSDREIEKFCTGLITGLIKDLGGLFNSLVSVY